VIKKRLSKTLAAAGIASRRACEDLIFAGKVKVNGEVALLPQTMVSDSDKIEVNGQPIKAHVPFYYIMLNKPIGYVCSTVGSQSTRLVLDLIKNDIKERLFTIGRLDKNTEGLILVTNDGQFANKVIHPSSNISKEYVAKTDHEITDDHLKAISSGTLVEGVFVRPLSVKKVRKGTVKIVIGEGKKREVRCLLENAGLDVLELKRTRIGSLMLGLLPTGSWRHLTEREKELIFE